MSAIQSNQTSTSLALSATLVIVVVAFSVALIVVAEMSETIPELLSTASIASVCFALRLVSSVSSLLYDDGSNGICRGERNLGALVYASGVSVSLFCLFVMSVEGNMGDGSVSTLGLKWKWKILGFVTPSNPRTSNVKNYSAPRAMACHVVFMINVENHGTMPGRLHGRSIRFNYFTSLRVGLKSSHANFGLLLSYIYYLCCNFCFCSGADCGDDDDDYGNNYGCVEATYHLWRCSYRCVIRRGLGYKRLKSALSGSLSLSLLLRLLLVL